ncbi:UNVERIFIED_CONTAM: hypothetical protein GTU68_025012 [Idotea baltica]|jgi:hypothetical protein
MKLL